MTADAYHMTATHPEGLGAYMGMQFALEDAELNASDVDYLNAHATSTPVGDLSEVAAIAASLFPEGSSLVRKRYQVYDRSPVGRRRRY
jgi:3-oxoacyl-[acyl-carrier-protein] synthase II